MLLFISRDLCRQDYYSHISKHLMLLFIKVSSDSLNLSFVDFKTSHAIDYKNGIVYLLELQNFKTSHVIVYPNVLILVCWFNYYFKTSHVIVYPSTSYIWSADGMIFQNISCYCLSPVEDFLVMTVNLFQNISCYCLSTENSYSPFVSTDFKTSHVIVYRKIFPSYAYQNF